jgi:SAM-dependent methyltransferase
MSAQQTWRERQLFEPGPLGWLVNPFAIARAGLLRELRAFFPELRGEVLDVGCGRMPYRRFVAATRYVGMDVDSPVTRQLGVADVYYDGRTFPFADASFDGILCSQVLEHVFTPDAFAAEIYRVLRPGGRLVLAVPFVWDEHEQPWDFARYSSFGLRALLEKAGFEVVARRKSVTDGRVLVQLGAAWFYKATRSRHRLLNAAAQLGIIAPVTAIGSVLAALLPRNEDLYLDNIVLARKPATSPRS